MPETNQIRELLAARGEELETFAVRAGIARRTLTNVINGRPTHRSTRRLIAQALELPENKVFSLDSDYYSSNASQEATPTNPAVPSAPALAPAQEVSA